MPIKVTPQYCETCQDYHVSWKCPLCGFYHKPGPSPSKNDNRGVYLAELPKEQSCKKCGHRSLLVGGLEDE